MPRASDLPQDIRAIAEINALRLRDSDWKNDFDSIVKTLRHLGFVSQSGGISDRDTSSESTNVTTPGWPRWAILASYTVAIGAIVFGVFMSLAHFGQSNGPGTRSLPDLSSGIWTLRNAKDNDGKNFSNSVLRFTSQEETSEGLSVRGTFTWRLDDIVVGSEEFTGRYVEKSHQLFLEGNAISPPSQPGLPPILTTGSYSAVVSPDGREIKDGHWGSTAENAAGTPGQWEAFR
jgi:hypothetical protein